MVRGGLHSDVHPSTQVPIWGSQNFDPQQSIFCEVGRRPVRPPKSSLEPSSKKPTFTGCNYYLQPINKSFPSYCTLQGNLDPVLSLSLLFTIHMAMKKLVPSGAQCHGPMAPWPHGPMAPWPHTCHGHPPAIRPVFERPPVRKSRKALRPAIKRRLAGTFHMNCWGFSSKSSKIVH